MTLKGDMKFLGLASLQKSLDELPGNVQQRAVDKGIKEAARHIRRQMKAAAPKNTGTLRRAITMRYSRRQGRAWIGLGTIKGETKTRFYYKTLEYSSARGAPLNPFMQRVFNSNRLAAQSLIINGTRQALYEESLKVWRRTKARGR